jgi:hypothetical protein
MLAVVASYGFGLLNPAGDSANEPEPEPVLVEFHVAIIGNDDVAVDVACAPSMYFTIVTVTGAGAKL